MPADLLDRHGEQLIRLLVQQEMVVVFFFASIAVLASVLVE